MNKLWLIPAAIFGIWIFKKAIETPEGKIPKPLKFPAPGSTPTTFATPAATIQSTSPAAEIPPLATYRSPFPYNRMLLNDIDDPYPDMHPKDALDSLKYQTVFEITRHSHINEDKIREVRKRLDSPKYGRRLERIAADSDYQDGPLTGKSLSDHSHMILQLCDELGIHMNPSARAIHRGQQYLSPEFIHDHAADLEPVGFI